MSSSQRMVGGVSIQFIRVDGQEIPIVEMDKDSVWSQNVSWMIQTATAVEGKAESQYEYIDDRGINGELRALGIDPEECLAAELVRQDLRHLKAVGMSGKRSVMMACVVALYRDSGRYTMKHKEFWDGLADYGLQQTWEKLMATIEDEDSSSYNYNENSAPSNTSSKRKEKDASLDDLGIKLDVVNDSVLICNLDTSSKFSQYASHLLQGATGETMKADNLFEYQEDKVIIRGCIHDFGLSAEEVYVASLKSDPSIVAVGTTGKRSVMFALTLALAVQNTAAGKDLHQQIMMIEPGMLNSMARVLRAAQKLVHGGTGKNRDYDSRKGAGKGEKGGAGQQWRDDGGGREDWRDSESRTLRPRRDEDGERRVRIRSRSRSCSRRMRSRDRSMMDKKRP